MTLHVLASKRTPNTEIAHLLGITEGAVRYRLRRAAEGMPDGRGKPRLAESVAEPIAWWMETVSGSKRPPNVRELHEYLVAEHEYEGSYKSVLRFVRARYRRPKIRTFRRVETPPGAQSQTDWAEYPAVDIGNGHEWLHAFVMVLSHSRKTAVVWSRSEDQLSWLHCHNEAYRRLGGIAAVNRIDNLKTGIAFGSGAWGKINDTYRSYARSVKFHVDACAAGKGNEKGKVEAKVRLSRLRLGDVSRTAFASLESLQAWTDERLEAWSRKATCPATGLSVHESWQRELERLPALQVLPEPFDIAVTRDVHKDCTIPFEGRTYSVPFEYVKQSVEVRGCSGKVQIWTNGRIIQEHPRHTKERLLLDLSCYEGPATERVLPPPPLGKMGRKLQQIYEMPVELRPLDLYSALMEVAR